LKSYTLSKEERLRFNKDFQRVYSEGKQFSSSNNKLRVNYYFESSINEVGIKAAFVVSKKAGNAVWRNRIKRLLRAVFRTNKLELRKYCLENNFLLYLIFSPKTLNQKQNKKVNLNFIVEDFIDLLQKTKLKLEKHA
jgi:ribonuclease P protein component